MDPIQITDTIHLVREEYPHYKPEDFKLFFKMAKKGYFGQVFGRMDGEVIMNWLAKYDLHRDTAAQNESIRECDKWKKLVKIESSTGVTYEEYLALKKRAREGDKEAIELLKTKK